MEVNLNLGISYLDMLKMISKRLISIVTVENELILENVVLADRFLSRLKGLMGKSKIEDDEGLLIRPCNSIHTFFMKFNLDIAFVDENFVVLEVYRDLAPNKLSKIYKKSKFVIEGKAGSLSKLNKGEKIKIVKKV
jgi:uncharacterized protein